MLYRDNAFRPEAPVPPYKLTTSDKLAAVHSVLDYRWLGVAAISPVAVIAALWHVYELVVAVIRLVHRF